jgi:hypothetical protein
MYCFLQSFLELGSSAIMTTTSDLTSQLRTLLSELRSHAPSQNSSFERVQFIILKTLKTQALPFVNVVELQLEKKFDLIHGDQISRSVNSNSILLEYAIPQDPQRLQPILTGQPRILINNEWFRLFTRLKNYYRVTIRDFLSSDLQNEVVMRKLINFLEPKHGAKYIFVSTFKTQSGFVGFKLLRSLRIVLLKYWPLNFF